MDIPPLRVDTGGGGQRDDAQGRPPSPRPAELKRSPRSRSLSTEVADPTAGPVRATGSGKRRLQALIAKEKARAAALNNASEETSDDEESSLLVIPGAMFPSPRSAVLRADSFGPGVQGVTFDEVDLPSRLRPAVPTRTDSFGPGVQGFTFDPDDVPAPSRITNKPLPQRADSFGPGVSGLNVDSLAPGKQSRLLGVPAHELLREHRELARKKALLLEATKAYCKRHLDAQAPRDRTSIDAILADPEQLQLLRLFCSANLCEESLLFVLRVRDFERADPELRASISLNICNNFLRLDAPMLPAISERVLERTLARVLDMDNDAFSEAYEICRSDLVRSVLPAFDTFVQKEFAAVPPPSATGSDAQHSKLQTILGLTEDELRMESARLRQTASERLLTDSAFLLFLGKAFKRSQSTLHLTAEDFPLHLILSDPKMFEAFFLYAEANACAEVLMLWRRINEFKIGEPSAAMALNIWRNFLHQSSPTVVALPSAVVSRCREALLANNVTSTLFDETQREVLQLITLSMYPSYLQFLNSSRVERKASVAHAAVATESEESTSDSEPSQFGLTPVMTRRAPAPSPETKLPVDVPLTIESACHASGVWHASFIEWCRSQSCGDYVALLQELASFATDEALFGDDQLHLEELNARGETLWADILESVVLRAGVADQVWSNVEKRGWSPSPFGPAADDLRRTIETSLFPRFQAWVAQRQRRVVSPRYSLPSLRDCLMEEDLYERFLAFAETSRSAETLLFWKAAEEYQLRHKGLWRLEAPMSDAQAELLAQEIIAKYLTPQLGLSARVRHQIESSMERHMYRDLFVTAQREVYLLLLDTYALFVRRMDVASNATLGQRSASVPASIGSLGAVQPSSPTSRVTGVDAFVMTIRNDRARSHPEELAHSWSVGATMKNHLAHRNAMAEVEGHPFWLDETNSRLRLLVCSAFKELLSEEGERRIGAPVPGIGVAELKLLKSARSPQLYRCLLISKDKRTLVDYRNASRQEAIAITVEFVCSYFGDYLMSYSPHLTPQVEVDTGSVNALGEREMILVSAPDLSDSMSVIDRDNVDFFGE